MVSDIQVSRESEAQVSRPPTIVLKYKPQSVAFPSTRRVTGFGVTPEAIRKFIKL